MASLNITPEMAIEAICKPYLDTLSNQPEKRAQFINDMKDAAKTSIQSKINEAQSFVDSAIIGAQNAISSATSFTTGVLVNDPMAPVASMGVIASTRGSLSMAKATLEICSTNLLQAINIVSLMRLPIPQAITSATSLINQAKSALSII